jgi:hypothetical protein
MTANNSAGIKKSKIKLRLGISLEIEKKMGNTIGIQMSTVPIVARICVNNLSPFTIFSLYFVCFIPN